MKTVSTQYSSAVSALLLAHQLGKLSHGREGICAVTCLFGGKRDWMDVINPTTGHIDHWSKYNHPRLFAKGLQLINTSTFSVEEVIKLEALFEGRVKDKHGNLVSTLDDDNDPGACMGLHAVLSGLEEMERKQKEPQVSQILEIEVA